MIRRDTELLIDGTESLALQTLLGRYRQTQELDMGPQGSALSTWEAKVGDS